MQQYIQRAKQNEFLRQNAAFFWGSLGVTIINFMYFPVLSRLLAPADFGDVQTGLSLYNQSNIPFWVLTSIAMLSMSQHKPGPRRTRLLAELEKLAYWMAGLFVAGSLLLGPALAASLQLSSWSVIAVIGMLRVVAVPMMFGMARVHGEGRFGRLSKAQVLQAGSRLLFSVVFVLVGLEAPGATAGLASAFVVAYLYLGRGPSKRELYSSWRERMVPNWRVLRPQARFGAILLVSLLSIHVLINMDIMLMKAYFAPDVAGRYAGVSAVGNLIFMVTGPFVAVLMPALSLQAGRRRNRVLLMRSTVLVLGVGGLMLAAMSLAPALWLRLLVGAEYEVMAHLLPITGLMYLMLALAHHLIHYFMTLRRYFAAVSALVGQVVMVVMVHARHGSVAETVTYMTGGVLFVLTLMVAGFGLVKAKRVRQRERRAALGATI